jgi:DNA-binding response OmpR family regulator
MDTRPAILLIDDNNDLLEIFQLVLNSKGFSIITARSAEQAITALKTFQAL